MKKSLITMIVTLALVAVVGVGATLAYLTSTTGTVTNTFTVGKVAISLTETSKDGKENTTKTGFDYENVLPGSTYDKEPVVTVADDSEDCWVFVKFNNPSNLEIVGLNKNLKPVEGQKDVYYYAANDGKMVAKETFTVFTGVKVSEDVKEGDKIEDVTIVASAVQYANVETVAAAFTAAFPAAKSN